MSKFDSFIIRKNMNVDHINKYFYEHNYHNTDVRFMDPFLLISLNVYVKLSILIFDPCSSCMLNINAFTNDKMIEHVNFERSTPYNIHTIFNSNPTPLFTVQVIVIPLTAFLVYDSTLNYESYTNFFKNNIYNHKYTKTI